MDSDEIKKLGTDSFNPKSFAGEVYKDIYKLSAEDQRTPNYSGAYGDRWKFFCEGWNLSHKKYKEQQRKDLKVEEFLEKLKVLCKEYNASVSSGCGCCGAGGHIEDYEFEIEVS